MIFLSLEHTISEFLDCHWDKKRPLLLAFSGGPDSLALLHLLLSYRKKHPSLSFSLAHVDHGWRPESQEEARHISLMAEQLKVPLHLTVLRPEEMIGNLEAACREERLKFFANLCTSYHYQAVLFGHHANDFAETVLKRVLEGSSLPYLSGLRPLAEVYGIKLWRPLLSVSKESLSQWLAAHFLSGFDDPTNRDTQFLRSRFRMSIIPQLSKEFGKNVSAGLCRIGEDAAELRDYLDQKIAPYLAKMISGKLGSFLDLSQECPESILELKYLTRRWCEIEGFSLSKESVELAAQLLLRGSADKKVALGNEHLYIDRKRLFRFPHDMASFPQEKIKLQKGITTFGRWVIRVEQFKQSPHSVCTNWQSLWREGEVVLPKGEYHLGIPELKTCYPRTSPLEKWWTNHKIPAFLRLQAPVIYEQNEMVHEFLTGKKNPRRLGENFLKITISA